MTNLLDQHAWNIGSGAWHEPATALPEAAPAAHPARLIAHHLPQFHPVTVNDAAWGAGFAEWTEATWTAPRWRMRGAGQCR